MSLSNSLSDSLQINSGISPEKVLLKFPDGNEREFKAGVTGYEIAGTISTSLSKKSVAYSFDGVLRDLDERIDSNGSIEIITRSGRQALELIRHDCAHVLAEAVQELWPDTQVTIGPVIENGFYYDFARDIPFTSEDLPIIENRMRKIIARNEPFSREIWSRQQAKAFFENRGEAYKVELIEAIPQDENIKIYRQGTWLDLCQGPHMRSTGDIGNAFRLTRVAGAYWRGDSSNVMLTRIYGTAFTEESQLREHMSMLEEARKRDHRKIGREMDLFHFQEGGPGVAFWHAKGWRLFQNLTGYMRRRLEEHGYEEVGAPQILDRAMWEKSGHWEWYHENMFITQTEDERIFAIKPMNCPGHVAIFKHGLKSYRDLPVRLAEFGVVHRYEPSGALHGLMRVRGFTQDDAHVFCIEEQLHDECMRINDLIISTYNDFGFSDFEVLLSTRPEKRVGDDASWDHAEEMMRVVLEDIESDSDGTIKTGINSGEGAFYGPKFEYVLKDALGRSWQCGTTQVDFNLPDRLDAFYIDSQGNKKRPVMIHRAICGSMERFLGILIENYAGRFPLWLAPCQVVVATITEEANNYAKKVTKKLKEVGLIVEADLRNEKISYKVREHSLSRIPVIMVCGLKEAQEGSVNIRRLGSREQRSFMLDDAIASLTEEAQAPDEKRKQKKQSE